MEWVVEARPVKVGKYRYAIVQIYLPPEYAGRRFVVRPIDEEPVGVSRRVPGYLQG